MTSARLLACTLVLAFGACATPGRTTTPTTPARYELCTDPRFDCVPAAMPTVERAIQIDTNLASPHRAPALG